jgi:hypothetical protein
MVLSVVGGLVGRLVVAEEKCLPRWRTPHFESGVKVPLFKWCFLSQVCRRCTIEFCLLFVIFKIGKAFNPQ